MVTTKKKTIDTLLEMCKVASEKETSEFMAYKHATNVAIDALNEMDEASLMDRNRCWYCGGKLIWQSDYNYDEVFCEGEGIATYLVCSECGAEVQYSLRTDGEE